MVAVAFLVIQAMIAGSALPARAEIRPDKKASVGLAQCTLENCWKETFPEVTRSVNDGYFVVRAYEDHIKEKLARADDVDEQDEAQVKEMLNFKLSVLKNALNECDDIKAGPGKQRHVIILGHQFYNEGGIFSATANVIRRKAVAAECKGLTGEALSECSKRIVIKSDLDKQDLLAYLGMLGSGSTKLTYVGHGVPDGVVLGSKNLLLPSHFDSSLSISRADWLRLNTGMFYADELTGNAAGTLARVVTPGSSVQIYACETGQTFGPKLKDTLGDATKVEASLTSMHFEFALANGTTVKRKDGAPQPNGVPVLVPDDSANSFIQVKGSTGPKAATFEEPVNPKALAIDRAAETIALRLATNAASGPVIVDGGKRAIFFSDAEKKIIANMFVDRIVGHGLKPGAKITDTDFEARLESGIKYSWAPERKQVYQALLDKVRASIQESVRLYYK